MPLAWLFYLAFAVAAVFGASVRFALAEPEQDYVLHCQGCHGPDGRGSADGAPPFPGNLRALASHPAGREYLLRVPGVTYSELDDERIAAVMNWLIARFDPPGVGEEVRAFTREEVARLRPRPLLSVPRARAEALANEGTKDSARIP